MDGEVEKTGEPERADLALELNFVPTWARRPPTENPYADGRFEGRESRGAEERHEGRERFRAGAPGARGRGFERRPPRREGGLAAPKSADGGSSRPPREARRGRPAPERPAPAGAAPSAAPRPAPLPIEIHFLPERRRLGAAAHRIHATRRAYPLSELAHLFLAKPEFYEVKIERARGAAEPLKLYLCEADRMVFLQREEALAHAVARHSDRFFEARETELGPPQGQFVCVARCRRSGRLLGPPNHHAYNENLLQAHDEVAPELTLDEYRREIETVRDPEVIEQWKREASKVTLYHRRDMPDAPPLKPHEARALLRDQLAPALIREVSHATVPAAVAMNLEDERLRALLRDAWSRESRFPMSLMYALRPALRHMGLHLFKAGSSHTFVTAVAPSPIAPERAIAPIRAALDYLAAHPGCTRAQMLQDLFPGRDPAADAEARALLGHLHWLVEKGHVIEFFDGTLSIPHAPAPRGGESGRREKETPAASV